MTDNSKGNNIIQLFKDKFDVGNYAWHDRYGYCRIIAIDGNDYTIRVIRKGPGQRFFKTYEVDVMEIESIERPLLDDVTLQPIYIPMQDE